jgi:uncharacterized protein YyaL (SSP411 family)
VTGSTRWRDLAAGVIASASGFVRQAPQSCATLLSAWLLLQRGPRTAVVAGERLLTVARQQPDPFLAVVPNQIDRPWACLEGRRELTDQVLICTRDACLAPAVSAEDVAARLRLIAG